MYSNAASVEHFADGVVVHSRWAIDDDAYSTSVQKTRLEVMLYDYESVFRIYVDKANVHSELLLDAMLGIRGIGRMCKREKFTKISSKNY